MNAETCAALLLHGEFGEGTTRELDDPELRQEVERRLASCGLRLVRRAGAWSAAAADPAPTDGAHNTWRIDSDETIVLMTFLALLRRHGHGWVERDALLAAVAPRLWSAFRLENVVLPRLLNRRLLSQDGSTLRPGPRFSAIDIGRARDRLSVFDDLIQGEPDA
jgi:hypothetical protein